MAPMLNTLQRASVLLIILVMLVSVVSIKVVYAQSGTPEPPSIDQIVSGLMQAVGTWLVAYVVNMLRVKFGIIPGSVFLVIVVNVIGLGISWLQAFLGIPGHSWILSLFATFGAVFLSQMQAQLNGKSGPAQYMIGTPQ